MLTGLPGLIRVEGFRAPTQAFYEDQRNDTFTSAD